MLSTLLALYRGQEKKLSNARVHAYESDNSNFYQLRAIKIDAIHINLILVRQTEQAASFVHNMSSAWQTFGQSMHIDSMSHCSLQHRVTSEHRVPGRLAHVLSFHAAGAI